MSVFKIKQDNDVIILLMWCVYDRVENMVGKGEKAYY